MARLTKLVVAPGDRFYSREDTYVCTACAKSFHFPPDTPSAQIEAVYQEHRCVASKTPEPVTKDQK